MQESPISQEKLCPVNPVRWLQLHGDVPIYTPSGIEIKVI
jgi:hypothetical protein